jgi:hypothetical protein
LVGGYSFYFFPVTAFFFFFFKMKQTFVGSGVKIRVGRVTGNQQLFILDYQSDLNGGLLMFLQCRRSPRHRKRVPRTSTSTETWTAVSADTDTEQNMT